MWTPQAGWLVALGSREQFHVELGPFQMGTVGPRGQVRKLLAAYGRNRGLSLNLSSQPGIWPALLLTLSPRPSVLESPSYCPPEPPSSRPGHAPQSSSITQQVPSTSTGSRPSLLQTPALMILYFGGDSSPPHGRYLVKYLTCACGLNCFLKFL